MSTAARHDLAVVVLLLGSFVVFWAVHLLIVLRLARTGPAWHALVALVALPMAPYWAARAKLRVHAALWCIACVLWGATRLFLAK